MGDDDEAERRSFFVASRHLATKALLATCVVVAAAKIKSIGMPASAEGRKARSVPPFTQPGDGWPKKLTRAHLAQLDARRGVL